MMQPGHISLPNGMAASYPGDDSERVVGVTPTSLTCGAARMAA